MQGNPDSGIWIFLLVEYAESWAFESGIQLKESGIPLTIEIQNPGSTDKDWKPVPGICNPQCRGIQNPKLSWITLHGNFIHLPFVLTLTIYETTMARH